MKEQLRQQMPDAVPVKNMKENSPFWVGDGACPVLAVALHDGHALRSECASLMALSAEERLREEDPYTGGWAELFETHAVIHTSRFEVDLNRPEERAVYRTPDDAWGLQVWKTGLPDAVVERSLAFYRSFYRETVLYLLSLTSTFQRVVVLDLHSYNHRRAGRRAAVADPSGNPQINVGTGTMDRTYWAPVVDRFIQDMQAMQVGDGRLDVRENIRFRGGHFAHMIHRTFPETVCVLSVEVKKFFMDEWTGALDGDAYCALAKAFECASAGLQCALEEMEDPGRVSDHVGYFV